MKLFSKFQGARTLNKKSKFSFRKKKKNKKLKRETRKKMLNNACNNKNIKWTKNSNWWIMANYFFCPLESISLTELVRLILSFILAFIYLGILFFFYKWREEQNIFLNLLPCKSNGHFIFDVNLQTIFWVDWIILTITAQLNDNDVPIIKCSFQVFIDLMFIKSL